MNYFIRCPLSKMTQQQQLEALIDLGVLRWVIKRGQSKTCGFEIGALV